MWGKNLINHINQIDIAHPAEELLNSHQLGHHKMMTLRLLKTLLLIYHFLVGQWLWMLAQIIICHIFTYDICFWSLCVGGLLIFIYVTFFHHIYDIDIWKLKNVVPSVVLGYFSQASLCILVIPSKLSSTFLNWANL
jgi:hypothetical protein